MGKGHPAAFFQRPGWTPPVVQGLKRTHFKPTSTSMASRIFGLAVLLPPWAAIPPSLGHVGGAGMAEEAVSGILAEFADLSAELSGDLAILPPPGLCHFLRPSSKQTTWARRGALHHLGPFSLGAGSTSDVYNVFCSGDVALGLGRFRILVLRAGFCCSGGLILTDI